jgi:hypothetical protein
LELQDALRELFDLANAADLAIFTTILERKEGDAQRVAAA